MRGIDRGTRIGGAPERYLAHHFGIRRIDGGERGTAQRGMPVSAIHHLALVSLVGHVRHGLTRIVFLRQTRDCRPGDRTPWRLSLKLDAYFAVYHSNQRRLTESLFSVHHFALMNSSCERFCGAVGRLAATSGFIKG